VTTRRKQRPFADQLQPCYPCARRSRPPTGRTDTWRPWRRAGLSLVTLLLLVQRLEHHLHVHEVLFARLGKDEDVVLPVDR
jgi:hypothetical protein